MCFKIAPRWAGIRYEGKILRRPMSVMDVRGMFGLVVIEIETSCLRLFPSSFLYLVRRSRVDVLPRSSRQHCWQRLQPQYLPIPHLRRPKPPAASGSLPTSEGRGVRRTLPFAGESTRRFRTRSLRATSRRREERARTRRGSSLRARRAVRAEFEPGVGAVPSQAKERRGLGKKPPSPSA